MMVREGAIRHANPHEEDNPLFGGDDFNLEIFFRGHWVHFGSFATLNINVTEYQDAYRLACSKAIVRLIALER